MNMRDQHRCDDVPDGVSLSPRSRRSPPPHGHPRAVPMPQPGTRVPLSVCTVRFFLFLRADETRSRSLLSSLHTTEASNHLPLYSAFVFTSKLVIKRYILQKLTAKASANVYKQASLSVLYGLMHSPQCNDNNVHARQ